MSNMEYKQLLKNYIKKIMDITGDDFIYAKSEIILTQPETDELSDILDDIISELSLR